MKRLDLASAFLMALAAVVTAWATYQGGQWDSAAADARASSALLRSDAGRAASDAVSQSVIDATLWVEWEKAVTLDRDQLAGFLRDRFSPALDAAQEAWLGRTAVDADGNPVDGTLPKGTPLALEVYVPDAQTRADSLAAQAEEQLAAAARAGETSTRYTLQAVMLAMVLFFASVAAKFTESRIQMALTGVAVVMLGVVALRMAGLPVL